MPRLRITESVLRDGQESLLNGEMTTSEMVPVLPILDKIGYHSLDVWGGSIFDTCLYKLKEDPWQRLRIIRANIRHTKLEMLLGGQFLFGYHPYSDDVVQSFVQRAIDDGIDILRVYDPLNDPRNLETAIRAAKREKAHVKATICYSPQTPNSTEFFREYARQLRDMGADSLCIQDSAGLLRPYDAYQIIKNLRADHPNTSIQLHTHYTSGLASMTVLKAVEAGADAIDTALSPFSLAFSLPTTETTLATFRGTPYETELDVFSLAQTADYFSAIRAKYLKSGRLDPRLFEVRISPLNDQIPGSMVRFVTTRLAQANKERYLSDVLKEIPAVHRDVGLVPLVYPIDQTIATQAILNALSGERYKIATEDFKSLIGGYFGKTPLPVDQQVQSKVLKDMSPTQNRPADLLKPSLEDYRRLAAPYAEQEEDHLSLALFEESATDFFEWRKQQKYKIDSHAVHPTLRTAVHPI